MVEHADHGTGHIFADIWFYCIFFLFWSEESTCKVCKHIFETPCIIRKCFLDVIKVKNMYLDIIIMEQNIHNYTEFEMTWSMFEKWSLWDIQPYFPHTFPSWKEENSLITIKYSVRSPVLLHECTISSYMNVLFQAKKVAGCFRSSCF